MAVDPDAIRRMVSPMQMTGLAGLTNNVGNGRTITTTGKRTLSTPDISCVTYQVVVPARAVEGMGAVVDPVPPVAAVYQRMIPGPEALRALGV